MKINLQFFGGRGGGSGKGGKSGGGGSGGGRTYEQLKEAYDEIFFKRRELASKIADASRELIRLQHANAPSAQITKAQKKLGKLQDQDAKYINQSRKLFKELENLNNQ